MCECAERSYSGNIYVDCTGEEGLICEINNKRRSYLAAKSIRAIFCFHYIAEEFCIQ